MDQDRLDFRHLRPKDKKNLSVNDILERRKVKIRANTISILVVANGTTRVVHRAISIIHPSVYHTTLPLKS